jgi:hypothetical protein
VRPRRLADARLGRRRRRDPVPERRPAAGKIVSAEGGKLTIKTEGAGDVTVDLAKAKTFSTDEPIVVKSGDTTFRSKVSPGDDGTVQVVPIEGGARRRSRSRT